MSRVSVIIPSYNHARFLPEAIESALRQTYRDFEVIVVDDGSTDETAEVARRYASRVRYHWQQNRGLSAARNAGCRLAQGRCLAFLDADDRWHPDKLERQVTVLERDAGVGLVSHAMALMDALGNPLPGVKPSRPVGESFSRILSEGTAPPSSYLIREELFRRIGGFDEQLAGMQDLDLVLRAVRLNRLLHLTECLGTYRINGSGLSENKPRIHSDYVRLFERLLADGLSGSGADRRVVLRRLAHYRYLWGRQEMLQGRVWAGRRMIGQAIREWPWLGWSLAARPAAWRRALNVARPYAVLWWERPSAAHGSRFWRRWGTNDAK